MTRRTKGAALIAAALTASLGLAACGGSSNNGASGNPSSSSSSGNGGSGNTSTPGTSGASLSKIAIDNNAATPAPAVEGAKKGGTLNLLDVSDFEHLDPVRAYVNVSMVFSRLIYRTLTTYYQDPKTGKVSLVGDMATDTGTPTDGGKVWTFTLRDGLKYEDGSPVQCADIKYNVERSFATDILDGGPTYPQQYLQGGDKYPGPYKPGGEKGLDSIKCNGNKIEFDLAAPHGDFNMTVAMGSFAAVPKAKDTRQNYDNHPFSNGPYKIESYQRGKSMVLVRNTYWDPNTDPVRHDYPDKIVVTQGMAGDVIDQQIMSDSGTGKTGIGFDSLVQPQTIPQVESNPAMKDRTFTGPTIYTDYIPINMDTVKDVKVRQAINWAIDKDAVRKAAGGPTYGDFATTMIPPMAQGYKQFSLYGDNPKGDPAKAKELLAGVTDKAELNLTYGFANTPTQQKIAAVVKNSLEKAGFTVTLKPIERSKYYSTIGKRTADAPDIMRAGWGFDWPNASTIIPPLFDGNQMTATDAFQNYSRLNDPTINQEIAAASAETDPNKQAQMWGDLDQKITELGAYVPMFYLKNFQIAGSGVGGLFQSNSFGTIDPINAYIK